MSCGHFHGAFSHFRGPNRRKKPIPKCRIDLGLLFEGCIRHSTLWQLLKEKEIKFPLEEDPVVRNENAEAEDVPTNATESPENGKDTTIDDKKKESNIINENLSVDDVITKMVVLFPKTKEEINAKLKNVINVLRDDLEAVQRVAREIVEDAGNNGVKYLEVGLDPGKFVSPGNDDISYSAVIEAGLRGLREGAERSAGTKAGIIVQCERGRTGDMKGILTICEKLKNEGVVGVEMTCNETVLSPEIAGEGGSVESLLYTSEDIAFMAEAKDKKIRRSVQAGEFGPPDMVFQAIEKLGADRVVFGYSVLQDPSLYHDIRTNKIHVVTSPSMSLLTSSVPMSTFYHPIVQFSEDNMEWSVSAGCPVITGGWNVQEFELLQSWGLSETDLAQATFSAARASFCGDGDRKELMKELRKVFGIEDKVELEIFINHKCGQPDDPRKVLKTSF